MFPAFTQAVFVESLLTLQRHKLRDQQIVVYHCLEYADLFDTARTLRLQSSQGLNGYSQQNCYVRASILIDHHDARDIPACTGEFTSCKPPCSFTPGGR